MSAFEMFIRNIDITISNYRLIIKVRKNFVVPVAIRICEKLQCILLAIISDWNVQVLFTALMSINKY